MMPARNRLAEPNDNPLPLTLRVIKRTYWVVIDKETGDWLPDSRGGRATQAELTKDKPPRLFNNPGHAKNAVTHWLKGICFGTTDTPDPVAHDTMWPDAEAVTVYVRQAGTERPHMKDRLLVMPMTMAIPQ